jgi:hypothetical protein
MIEGMFGEVSKQPAQGFRRVKAMAFGKSLYLLEALVPTEGETVRYSHITGEVTEQPILLQTLDFMYVTVSNLLKPILANSFVLRLLPFGSESFLHFWGNLVFLKAEEEVHEKVSVVRSDCTVSGLWIRRYECRGSSGIR